MGIRVASISHPGQAGKINQDAVYAKTWVSEDLDVGIIAVADGMGGYSSGEKASKTAIEALKKWCDLTFCNGVINIQTIFDSLNDVFFSTHNLINSCNAENGEKSGTTLAICLRIGRQYTIKNTGDTRCYLLSNNTTTQISIDDSWVAMQIQGGLMTEKEALSHHKQNLLIRCLGMGKYEKPHSYTAKLCLEQILCVCSDGFYKYLQDEEFIDLVNEWQSINNNPLDKILPTLYARGERDNISVALMY